MGGGNLLNTCLTFCHTACHFKRETSPIRNVWFLIHTKRRLSMRALPMPVLQAPPVKKLPAEMRYFDTARVYLKGGNGGNGCVAFRREKYVPRGKPSLDLFD